MQGKRVHTAGQGDEHLPLDMLVLLHWGSRWRWRKEISIKQAGLKPTLKGRFQRMSGTCCSSCLFLEFSTTLKQLKPQTWPSLYGATGSQGSDGKAESGKKLQCLLNIAVKDKCQYKALTAKQGCQKHLSAFVTGVAEQGHFRWLPKPHLSSRWAWQWSLSISWTIYMCCGLNRINSLE